MIGQMWMLAILVGLVAAMFGVLIALLGWMGNKMYVKVNEIALTMHKMESDLHGRIGA